MLVFTGMFATALIFVMYRLSEHPRVRSIVRFWAIMGALFWLAGYGIVHSIMSIFS